MTFGGNNFNYSPENQLIKLLQVILKIHNLTFNDAQIDFNDTQLTCVILHAKITYERHVVT